MRKRNAYVPDTEENKNKIREMVEAGEYISDIALKFNVARDTMKKFILYNKLPMPASVLYKKYTFTEEQRNCIALLLKRGCSLTMIGSIMNVDKSVIGRIIKQYNIFKEIDNSLKKFPLCVGVYKSFIDDYMNKNQCNLETANIEYQKWLNEELGKLKQYAVNTKSQRFGPPPVDITEYILKNHNQKSVIEISQDLKIPEQRIRHYSRLLGVTCHAYGIKTKIPDTEEFNEDIANPMLSPMQLSFKYHISDTILRRIRKERFGNKINMFNSYLKKSTAEIKFE